MKQKPVEKVEKDYGQDLLHTVVFLAARYLIEDTIVTMKKGKFAANCLLIRSALPPKWRLGRMNL